MAGKVALVTGGGSGVGKASAVALARMGFSVVITGRRQAMLDDTVKAIAAAGAKGLGVAADVADAQSVAALFARIRKEFGRLDFLFNNAGTGAPAIPMEDLTVAQWQTVVDTNLTGAFLCTQQALRMFKEQNPQGGRIVNNGSISAHTPRPHSVAYTATKHAITGLTKSTALDGRPFNIACGQIDIGNARTDMTARMSAGVLQANGSTAPEPVIDADKVAEAVAYMAGLPLDMNVLTMTVMATQMPFVGRG